jgi:fructokinase
METDPLVAGVELGGTKCVLTLAAGPGRIADRRIVPTAGPGETLAAIGAVLAGWWADPGFASLGIASFGPLGLDRSSPGYGTIAETPKPGWSGTPVLARLADPFPVPTGFDTDVNGAALAERLWGAGRGLDDFAYVTVGTGIGVGLIVSGRPTRGFAHCELGHVRPARPAGDDWPGACPYHGDCVEGLASGTAIGKRLGLASAADLPADHAVWDGVAHALAQLCHVLVCAAAPRRIAMGGGVITGRPELLARIEPLLAASLAGYMRLPGPSYVCAPGLGEEAGPLGPIALALAAAEADRFN